MATGSQVTTGTKFKCLVSTVLLLLLVNNMFHWFTIQLIFHVQNVLISDVATVDFNFHVQSVQSANLKISVGGGAGGLLIRGDY